MTFDYYNHLQLTQGENGILYFKANDYKFKEGDIITFVIFDKERCIFKKDSNLVENNLIYLELTNEETTNFPVGTYLFSVRCNYDHDQTTYLIENNEVIIKEGIKC